MVISGQNDDFYGMFDGDNHNYYRSVQDCNGLTHSWGYLSRLYGSNIFNNNVRHFIISKHSSYGDNTTVDAYASVDKIWDHYWCQKDGTPCFPEIQEDYGCQDAIGRDGGVPEYSYNCFGWAGGTTEVFFDPYREGFPGNVWYVPDNPQATLDNWYGNTPDPRTPTATTLTRTGANYDNSVLDVWKDDKNFFSHASVSKNTNGHYHGYAWESKLGTTGKIMHDRHQLRRADYYGDVYQHYIPNGSFQATSSTSFNGEMVEAFEIDAVHREKITKIVSKTPSIAIQEIEMYYSKWKKYCDNSSIKYSSLRAPYLNNDIYDTLISVCKKHGKNAMAILIKKFCENDPYTTMPIYDMLPKYDPEKVIWNSFRTGSMHGKRSLDGKFIRETPRSNWGKYIQKIMDKNNF